MVIANIIVANGTRTAKVNSVRTTVSRGAIRNQKRVTSMPAALSQYATIITAAGRIAIHHSVQANSARTSGSAKSIRAGSGTELSIGI